MAIPLTLSDVPDATPYIQYVASGGQTVYPYPFPITQDSDLVVVVNGITQNTDSTYSLSGQGNPTGGNVTLNSGSTAGDIVTLYRDIQIERLTQFAQNGGFSSSAFNAEFNNLYLIAQQLEAAIQQCLQIPNTNNPAPTTTLAPLNYAGKYLAFDSNGNPTAAVLTSSGTLTQSLFNSFLQVASEAAIDGALGASTSLKRTAAEISASVIPTNFTYDPDPFEDVRRYGWGASPNTATSNTAALNTALSVIAGAGGGIVQLPKGSYSVNDSIVIPPGCIVRGAGMNGGTTLTSGSTGNPVFCPGSFAKTGVFNYGCGLTDLQIILTQTTGKSVRLMETVGAEVRNVYTQGPIAASRGTVGVTVDGGNVGAFFNLIQNVECAHFHVGFDQLTSGTTAPTMQSYINISGTGDVSTDTTSIGYRLSGAAGTGGGTVVTGSDFENCANGMYFTSGCGSSTNLGSRGEGNTTNVYCETGAGAQTFLGGILNIANGGVRINSGTTLNSTNGAGIPHRFWGSMNGSNLPDAGYWAGTNFFYGAATGDAPVTAVAFPGDTTTPILDLQNSSGNHLFQVSAQGKFLRIANAAPAMITGSKAANAALGSLITALANVGLLVDGTT